MYRRGHERDLRNWRAAEPGWAAGLSRLPSGLRFAGVGGLAFVADMVGMGLLIQGVGLSALAARGLCLPLAASLAWYLNRRLTFDATGGPLLYQWLAYMGTNAAGLLVNVALYALIVSASALAAAHPLISAMPGGLVGLLVHYRLAARLVFVGGALSSHR